jgi:hypothetical protein
LDSSSSDDTGNTNKLLEDLPKNKDPLSKKETTTHTLTTNKSSPTKEDPIETYLESDQKTTTTGKEPPLPIGEDTNTIITTTNEKKPTRSGSLNSYNRYSIDHLDHYYNLWTLNLKINNGCSKLKPRGPKII